MDELRSRKTTCATFALVLCFLLSDFRIVKDAPWPRQTDSSSDIAQRSDQRFLSLKTALPESGIVGYAGETGGSALADYYLAQYALAPLVVDHSLNHKFVIGNFPSGVPQTPDGFYVVKDFGAGVLLFVRKGGE